MLNRTCECRYKAHWLYCKALGNTGVWPIEPTAKTKSVSDLLEGLAGFSYTPPEEGCLRCKQHYDYTIKRVCQEVSTCFDGLCMSCMEMTKSCNIDKEYWAHGRSQDWNKGCEIRHGQPTWYFSYMGRRDYMHRFQIERKARKAAYDGFWDHY